MTIEEKVKNKIEEKHGNLKKFSEQYNLNYHTVDKILKRSIENAGALRVYQICSALGVDFDALMKGEVKEKLSDPFGLTLKERDLIESYRTLDDFGIRAIDLIMEVEKERNEFYANDIPFVWKPKSELGAAAGFGQTLSDYMTMIKIPKTRIAESADFVVRVDGDSMEPEYQSGDYVLVRSQPDIDLGQTGIYILNGEGYIKQKGENQLISLNSDYPPIDIKEGDSLFCCGLVLESTEIIEEDEE